MTYEAPRSMSAEPNRGDAAASQPLRVVFTGGPSAGKTTVLQSLGRDFRDRVALTPEAATILFSGGLKRSDEARVRRHQQRAIYFLQRELEAIHQPASPDVLQLCDRGTLDGAAYWPSPGPDFYASLSTSPDAELGRYAWVFHLDTASEAAYGFNNPVRTEGYQQALALNARIRDVWSPHPRRLIFRSDARFSRKLSRVTQAITMILDGASFEAVRDAVDDSAER